MESQHNIPGRKSVATYNTRLVSTSSYCNNNIHNSKHTLLHYCSKICQLSRLNYTHPWCSLWPGILTWFHFHVPAPVLAQKRRWSLRRSGTATYHPLWQGYQIRIQKLAQKCNIKGPTWQPYVIIRPTVMYLAETGYLVFQGCQVLEELNIDPLVYPLASQKVA